MVDSTNLPEVDINQIATDLNGKMDRDGVNASCPTLLSRTANSAGGVVEIWSDGYCVQTGNGYYSSTALVNLFQNYIDTTYMILITPHGSSGAYNFSNIYDKTTSSFKLSLHNASGATNSQTIMWRTEGYIR